MNVKIPKIPRDNLVNSGIVMSQINSSNLLGVGNNKFPNNLSSEKSISIHVYNTSKYDMVFNGLLDTTQNIASIMTGMFSSGGNKVSSLLGGSNIFQNTVERAVGGFFGTSGNSMSDMFSGFFNSIPQINIGIGNNKLNQTLSKTYYETFHLPIPNNLQEALNNTYEEQPGWINDMPGIGLLKGAVNMATDKKSLSTATWSKLTGARSLQYYENKLQMYSSTDFREISMVWDLVPNNAAESATLHEIVRKIKMYGSPETAGGKLILKSPCFFGIEFTNKTLDKALQFYEVVLVSAEIEYVPGGNMEMYEDETPKHIQLTLSFRDRQPKLKEDWENPGSSNNTGSNNQNCPV